LLVLITNLSTLLPLPFLGWLPGADPKASGTASMQATPAMERDLATTKQLGQPFLPDLMSEWVPQAMREPVEETID
jgi:hypothetical protein